MSPELSTIMIVDDARALRFAFRTVLSHLGHVVVEAERGEEALSLMNSVHIDAVLLEINLPGMRGVDVCRLMRCTYPRLPIIMLAVLDSENDKVEAFKAGADDYITKPFQMQEMIGRLGCAIRRNKVIVQDSKTIIVGEIELNVSDHTVKKAGQQLHLTPKEFKLLRHLMSNAGRPIPHVELLKSIWGAECAYQLDYLRTFVRQLRKKIEDDPTNPHYLLTAAQIGYCFNEAFRPGQRYFETGTDYPARDDRVPQLSTLPLIAQGSENRDVEALGIGTDNYTMKRLHLCEIDARLHASTRRNKVTADHEETICIGDVLLDPGRHLVKKKGRAVHLTPKQFELLHYLMVNAGRPIPHAKLLRSIWGAEYGNELEYLRTFIRQIRVKIEDEPANPQYLLTESHVGYRFVEE